MKDILIERSGGICEVCSSENNLDIQIVYPYNIKNQTTENTLLVCSKCCSQIEKSITEDGESLDHKHLKCLSDSMWNPNRAVQIVVFRLLKKLDNEWSLDLLSQMYMENETQKVANEIFENESNIKTLDSNGQLLKNGDTVTLIKDLAVKGAGFTAKRGTSVSIRLTNNPLQVEGKVNGQELVLISNFLKKV